MNPYEEFYHKLRETLTDEEIAEAAMIPQVLSEDEQAAANEEFRRHRQAYLEQQTDQDRLMSDIMQLRARIYRYLDDKPFLPEFSFGKMLYAYQKILRYTQKQLAEETAIHATKLNRLLHDKESPNLAFLYRLEAHSKGMIPATMWWQLTVRRQGHQIEEEIEQRKQEAEKVKVGW
jgi:hypothetical protein